ncbi:hypothetical protein KAFR_0H01020 [Kazachstania africana CBS 2517]|uniref:General transcription and DNA repair factor IIH subunit TFB4 n=1 Tax=Kazachstania africana (strain ATCC 22294 / BCRC 22015 / CBS 2517 / CECT 1963 / NBRC 1671 / NRRL Y-8276) TaxID=1071382 RepID=H2AYV6_KAZAF|nr:hypothetical protein KAFR_0H01020 [Kazachstania africana CBS 2517]CCF59512.1 hypothetical protein KAFR_0H01020 [Kazachstania africana CBS 2517]
MDAIADPNFQHSTKRSTVLEETPSLLAVIIDIAPKLWAEFDEEKDTEGSIINVLQALLVFLNAHLAFNTSNQVAVIAAHSQGIKYLYPENNINKNDVLKSDKDLSIINKGMYRRFRNVDEVLVEELYSLFKEEQNELDKITQKSTLPGAISAGLTYVNRISKEMETLSLKSRLMVLTCGSGMANKEEIFQYIPIMNCIFSATKLKCPVDVVKIGGSKESTFLQQTTDATHGVYLHVETTKGLIQYLTTAMFIDPSLRQIIVKPNQGSVDFRTSCYLTGKVVAVGFICSVCLCVLSIIPPGNKCPACDSEFDERVINKLKKKTYSSKVS